MVETEKQEIVETIKEVLLDLRPTLLSHGGGAEFLSFEDGILRLLVGGVCRDCPLRFVTFQLSIEQALQEKSRAIKEIRYVTE